MENPFISVIITAYNRKEFILEALQSAVNQTLKRDKYEIICIKNFKDAKIDRYIKDKGIINVLKNHATIGEYLYIATKKSHGEIIVFLDDDDIFDNRKLSRVYGLLKSSDIEYYHNNITKEKEFINTVKLEEKALKITADEYTKKYNILHSSAFCMSAIAIKKILMQKYLKEVVNLKGNPDCFSLSISLANKANILIDNNKLTFYRVHGNNISKQNDSNKAIESEINLNIPSLKFIRGIIVKSNSDSAMFFLDTVIFQAQTRLDMLKGDKKGLIRDTINFFKVYGFKLLRNKYFLRRLTLILVFFVYKDYAIKRFLN